MAETMTVPGIGPVKQQYVIAGGALVAGMVGWAWYKRGVANAEPVPINPDSIPETDRTPVVGDSTGSFDQTDPTKIDTNGAWSQAATEYLVVAGWEGGAVAVALGKFLGHKPLTEKEIEIVLAAKGAFGEPPVGGPWPLTPALPTPPAPTGTVPNPVTQLAVRPAVRRNDIVWVHDGKNITHFWVQAKVIVSGSIIRDKVGAYPYSNQYVWAHNLAGGINKNYTVEYLVVPWNNNIMGPGKTVKSNFRMK